MAMTETWSPDVLKEQLANRSRGELAGMVLNLALILWPFEDPEARWEPNTIQAVADVLAFGGIGPDCED